MYRSVDLLDGQLVLPLITRVDEVLDLLPDSQLEPVDECSRRVVECAASEVHVFRNERVSTR